MTNRLPCVSCLFLGLVLFDAALDFYELSVTDEGGNGLSDFRMRMPAELAGDLVHGLGCFAEREDFTAEEVGLVGQGAIGIDKRVTRIAVEIFAGDKTQPVRVCGKQGVEAALDPVAVDITVNHVDIPFFSRRNAAIVKANERVHRLLDGHFVQVQFGVLM